MLYRIISALMIAGELILCLYISMRAHVSEFVSVANMGGTWCTVRHYLFLPLSFDGNSNQGL